MPFKAKCVGFSIETIGRKLVKTTVSFEHILPITTKTDYWFLTEQEYQKLKGNHAQQSLGGFMLEQEQSPVAAAEAKSAKKVAKKKTAKKAKKKVAKKAKKKTAKKAAKK